MSTTGVWYPLRAGFPVSTAINVTADMNNLAPSAGAGYIKLLGNASPHNITGMVAGDAGEHRIISNDTNGAGGNITLKFNNASSSVGNRFAGNNSADKVLAYSQSVAVVYDGTWWMFVS